MPVETIVVNASRNAVHVSGTVSTVVMTSGLVVMLVITTVSITLTAMMVRLLQVTMMRRRFGRLLLEYRSSGSRRKSRVCYLGTLLLGHYWSDLRARRLLLVQVDDG